MAMQSNWENIVKGALDRAARRNVYRCPKCSKTFSSGQALGGHHTGHVRREKQLMERRGVNQINSTSVMISGAATPNSTFVPWHMPYHASPAARFKLFTGSGGEHVEPSGVPVRVGFKRYDREGERRSCDQANDKTLQISSTGHASRYVAVNTSGVNYDGEDGNPMNLDLSLHL